MCALIELDLGDVHDARLDEALRRVPLVVSIRKTGWPWKRTAFALISAGGGCACDMFDFDTGELHQEQREPLASTVEAFDEILTGSHVLRATWSGEPTPEPLTAAALAQRIRNGELELDSAYRVSWRGTA
jgi:hypothetical protein